MEYPSGNSKPVRISDGHYGMLVLLPEAISDSN